VFQIYGSPTASGASAVQWVANVDWNQIVWANLPAFLTTTDPAYLAACTGSVYYAGLTTFTSNRVVYIGTNSFSGGSGGGSNGVTYTFGMTNQAAGSVWTNGTIVLIGTNVAAGPQGPQGPPGTNGAASSVFATNATYAVTVTGAQSNLLDTALQPGAIATCAGGYTVSNWWEPVFTATYRAVSAATSETTNSYLIYVNSLAESGLIDWSLAYRALDGWPPPPDWSIIDGTNYAYIATNRVWGITPGRVTVQGVSDGVSRTSILPINYGKIATPVSTLSSLLPGSPAALASLPIIAMASNYLATTTEPLVPRPTDWNTNETTRTNYAAVATWLPTPTWNTNCWLTNAPSLFSCTAFAVGTTPQASPLWHGVLISPRIIVKARHVRYNLGSTHWFLTPEGTLTNAVLSRWIDLYPDGGPDIVLGVLDRAMPTSMVARVATPDQIAAAFPAPTGYQTATYVHAVAFNQHLDASVLQLSATTEWHTYWDQPTLPQSLTLGPLYHPAHPGDSGCPIILAWGNTPVLLSLYYYAGSGSSISASLTDIATALAAEGETLTYINFEEVP
jgi:hypothetical protein